MIKQTTICLKLDSYQTRLLNDLCKEIGCNRNKLINFFVAQGIENLSAHKECALVSAYRKALDELL